MAQLILGVMFAGIAAATGALVQGYAVEDRENLSLHLVLAVASLAGYFGSSLWVVLFSIGARWAVAGLGAEKIDLAATLKRQSLILSIVALTGASASLGLFLSAVRAYGGDMASSYHHLAAYLTVGLQLVIACVLWRGLDLLTTTLDALVLEPT